jgi:plasmid stabilization system protein ParE
MPVRLIISPFAELDLLEIKNWYSVEENDLFLRFLKEFEHLINVLQADPRAFPFVYRNQYRKATMRIFPYKIIYSFDNGIVSICAIIHHKRNPKVWKSLAI